MKAAKRSAVVTGIGVVCSIAETAPSFWRSLCCGVSGVGLVDLFDTSGYRSRIGAQVRGIDLSSKIPGHGRWHRLGRGDLLGLWAVEEAIHDAGLLHRGVNPKRVAVVMGAGSGGIREAERYRRMLHSGSKSQPPSLLMPFPACNLSDAVGNLYGFFGPRSTIATACSSSATAIGYAGDLIRTGRADVVIAGGAESLSELTFAGFNALRSVDSEACRPFDRDRQGLVLGEGAGILVLESQESSASTPKTPYGEVLGYGICADAHHMTSPDPKGAGGMRAMAAALRNGSISVELIDYINAHGTGTPVNDRVETLAIKSLFGKRAYSIPVSSSKSAFGHCLGAAGALEAIATLLAVHNGVAPPTLNWQNADPECDLDYVPGAPRPAAIRAALSNSFAFGGNNTTLAFGRIES